jgi:regulatory protein
MVSRGDPSSPSGSDQRTPRKGRKGKRKSARRGPLDDVALRDLALSYAARYATTAAKLEGYLARKIRERGVAEDGDGRVLELDVTGLVMRLVELGYVDDDAYARARARDLTLRGYGARRVEQALWAAGVEETAREEHAPDEVERRKAAARLARKRGFGPYARSEAAEIEEAGAPFPRIDPAQREKRLAAMLRAGHQHDHARFILDAANRDEIEDWIAEAQEDEDLP